MKILFHDYSNRISDEPKYLFQALAQCGMAAGVWDSQKTSAFDALDSVKPDVLITHFAHLSNDIVTYLSSNRNIDLVLNITGATESQLKSIDGLSKEKKINIPFVFTNSFETILPKMSIRVEQLYPAANIFCIQPVRHSFNLEHAILSNSNEHADVTKHFIDKHQVYHLLYIGEDDSYPGYDAKVDMYSLSKLYSQYKKWTLIGGQEIACSQLFFDMALNCQTLEIRTDENQFNKMISKIFTQELTDEDASTRETIRNQIKDKHNPFNRAARLMKFLKNKDAMDKIESLKPKIKESLKDL